MDTQPASPSEIDIPSYRVVFRLERRLFKVGDKRLPLPYGLPLPAAGWFLAGLAVMFILGNLPGVGAITALLPAPFKYGLIPGALAFGISRLQLDGRPALRLARAWLRFRFTHKRVAAWRPVPHEGHTIRLADTPFTGIRGHEIRPGRLRVHRKSTTPTNIRLNYPCQVQQRGRTLHITQTSLTPSPTPARVSVNPGHSINLKGTEAPA